MSETCPDYFHEDWVDPHTVTYESCIVKEYEDGVTVVIDDPIFDIHGLLISAEDIETRYPGGGLHYELGYKSDVSVYFPNGIPENTEI